MAPKTTPVMMERAPAAMATSWLCSVEGEAEVNGGIYKLFAVLRSRPQGVGLGFGVDAEDDGAESQLQEANDGVQAVDEPDLLSIGIVEGWSCCLDGRSRSVCVAGACKRW